MGTLVGSSVNTQYTSTGSACAVTIPSGVQANDIIVVYLGHGNAATYSSTTSGFTNDVTISNGTAVTAARFTKTAAGTEGGTTFSTTLSSNSSRFLVCEVWRGVTLDSVNGTNTGSSSTPGDAAVTATAQPGVAVGFGAMRGAADGTTVTVSSAPSTYTLDTQQTSSLGGSNRNTGGGTWYKAITSTTVGAASATFSQSSSWATITTVLTDSASAVNVDATVTDTHDVTGSISATSPLDATVTDTHSTTGAAMTPGTENISATVTDTHSTTAAASATSPLDATATATFSTTGAVGRIDNADATTTLSFTTTASISSVDPFPFGRSRARVRLDLDGSGAFATDVTDYVKLSEGIEIERGLQSEGSIAGPAACKIVFDNSDLRFSPDYPLGPYYGQLVRNTPVQVSIPQIVTMLDVPVGVPSALSTPDVAALSITGDIDVRVWLQADDWQAGGSPTQATVIHKWTESGNQRSWAVNITDSGQLAWWWSTTGANGLNALSTASIPPGPRDQVLRITHDVDNGAGGNTVTIYTGPGLTGPWTQVGDPIVTAGTTSIYDSTSVVAIGDHAAGGGRWGFQCLGAMILDGIGGTARSTLDLTRITDGSVTVIDVEGHVWTPAAGAELVTWDKRYTGVVPEWPMEHGWITEDCSVPIGAADLLRRLGRSRAPSASAYRRAATASVPAIGNLVAYWPLEDAQGATSFGSGLVGGLPMSFLGAPALASNEQAFACSASLPVFDAATQATGKVPNHTLTNQIQTRALVSLPAAGVASTTLLFEVWTTGSVGKWQVSVDSSGNLYLDGWSGSTNVLSSGPISTGLNGRPARVSLALSRNGTGIDWSYSALPVGATVVSASASGTLASQTVGRAAQVRLAGGLGLSGCVLGHVTVQNAVTTDADLSDLLSAYSGETAQDRIARLCRESAIQVRIQGVEGLGMGNQLPGKVLDLLREAETSDDGILYSTRDRVALAYRSTDSMSARDPVLTGAYDALGISEFHPIKGDQGVVNDVTLSRTGGASVHVSQDVGPLSVLDPPNGIGLYDGGGSSTISLAQDDDLEHRAYWELGQGTCDAPRITPITWDLTGGPHSAGGAAHLSLSAQIRRLDVGDRILITGVPGWSLPQADQVIIGLREFLSPTDHEISAVTIPYESYRVGVADTDQRYSAEGATISAAITSTQTTVEVTNPADTEWTHDDGDFTVTFGGEEATVTAVGSSNRLPNPSADADLTGWIAVHGSITRETTITHSSPGSVKLVTDALAYPKIESDGVGKVDVSPGETVSLSAWLRADTSRVVHLVAEWYDSTGTYAGYAQIVDAQTVSANTWTFFQGTAVVPDDGLVAKVTLAGQNDGTPGAGLVLYLDDAVLDVGRQTLTLTRSTNGIVKSHPAGTLIDVVSPVRYGL